MLERLRRYLRVHRAIADQLASGLPPEVRAAYERLRATGLTRWRCRLLLVRALHAEVRAMLRERRFFDEESYARRLQALGSPR